MTEIRFPSPNEFSFPIGHSLLCTNCDYIGAEIRRLETNRDQYDARFAYLCPRCFKELILKPHDSNPSNRYGQV